MGIFGKNLALGFIGEDDGTAQCPLQLRKCKTFGITMRFVWFFLSLMVFENQNSSQITGTLAVEMNYDLFKAIV